MIFTELDEWSYDLEQDFREGNYSSRSKLQRKIMTLQKLRDKYHNIYLKNLKYKYGKYNPPYRFPRLKYCEKRLRLKRGELL